MATNAQGGITLAVEGMTDEAVVRRLVHEAGGEVSRVHVKGGSQPLQQRILGYNNAAQRSPWLVLTDLDRKYPCPALLVKDWLPAPAVGMRLGVVVQAVEAWLLADAMSFARFLGVSRNRLPRDREAIDDPKGLVVELARHSKRADIRANLVPRPGSRRRTGSAYASRLTDFVNEQWDVQHAAEHAHSLAGCLRCLRRLREFA